HEFALEHSGPCRNILGAAGAYRPGRAQDGSVLQCGFEQAAHRAGARARYVAELGSARMGSGVVSGRDKGGMMKQLAATPTGKRLPTPRRAHFDRMVMPWFRAFFSDLRLRCLNGTTPQRLFAGRLKSRSAPFSRRGEPTGVPRATLPGWP